MSPPFASSIPIPLRSGGPHLSRVDLGVSVYNQLLEVPTVTKATFVSDNSQYPIKLSLGLSMPPALT